MIQDVEHFKAELQKLPFERGEFFAYGAIDIPGTGIAEHVSGLHAEGACARDGKRVLVEPDGGIREGCRLQIGIAR